jgi:hypothetical protein
MQARVERAEAQVKAAEAGDDPWKTHQAGARLRRFSDLLEQWKQPLDPKPLKVEVQALRIGEAALVAMPGEPFAEIGVAVRTASPFEHTMFCGYSDGEGGDYMPIGPEYSHGGYEIERTPYNPGADAKVIDAATALLRELR